MKGSEDVDTIALPAEFANEVVGRPRAPISKVSHLIHGVPMKYRCLATFLVAFSSLAAMADIYTGAARIDRIVEGNLVAEGVRPYALIDDATYVRRAYLQLVGRIPTLAESEAFIKSKALNKRRILVDKLVESDGFVSHFYNYWADILRVKSRLRGLPGNAGDPYIKWIKESLTENKPYDAFVRELITSHGDTWDMEAGASGYYRRDRGMPLDNLANTVQIFLGTQIQCAQCHDHPFDQWTQKQFFEMAAFTNMAADKERGKGKGKAKPTAQDSEYEQFRRDLRKKHGARPDGAYRFIAKAFNDIMGNSIPNAGSGTIRLPKDYQYDNAKPNDLVHAKALFGEQVGYARSSEDLNSRETFAKWMTAPENPRFTMVIANRLWKQMMGAGLFEPVDDIRSDTKPSIPLLMHHLESEMKTSGYDLRQFMKMIAYTRSWQRVAHTEELDLARPYYFPGPVAQRLSAEQIWDSLLTLKVDRVDERKNPHVNKVVGTYKHLKKMDAEELEAEFERVADKLKDKKNPRQGDVAKVMGMAGGGMMMGGDFNADLREEMAELSRQLKKVKRQPEKAKQLRQEIAELRKEIQRSRGGAYSRASELPNPPPPGHFLREFGSSDREIIENAAKEASVTQALHLLNGFVDKELIQDKRSVVWHSLGDKPEQLAERAFLTILSRPPSERERAIVATYQEQAGDGAKAEMIWALVNTREFLFLR
jgi:hypothetical protein